MQHFEQVTVGVELCAGPRGAAVGDVDVDALERGVAQPGEIGGVTDQPLIGGGPVECDHDDPRFAALSEAVGEAVRLGRIGHRVVKPELRELL